MKKKTINKKIIVAIAIAALITLTLILIFTLKPFKTEAKAAETTNNTINLCTNAGAQNINAKTGPWNIINVIPTIKNNTYTITINNFIQSSIGYGGLFIFGYDNLNENLPTYTELQEHLLITAEYRGQNTETVTQTITTQYNYAFIGINVQNNKNIQWSWIMFNEGSTAAPFQFNPSEYIEQGYNQGLEEAKYGIFTGATFDMTAYEETESGDPGEEWSTTNQDLQPYLSGTGIYFNNFYKLPNYSTGNGDSNSISITIYTNPWIYQTGTNNIYFNGGNLGWTITIIDNNNNQYSTQADDYTTVNNRQLDFGVNANGKEITKIEIDFSVAVNTMPGTSMQVGNTGYNTGYTAGYNNGYKDGNTNGYSKGEEIGYNNGYEVGYNNGYTKGSTDEYGLAQLLTSVVDAPVTVFSDMLNFDILGFNLLNVIVAILSIALVIKVISIFTKGK